MDFAPYQSSPPETTRSPATSPRASTEQHHRTWSPFNPSSPPLQHPQPQRGWQPSLPGSFPAADAHREGAVSEFDTSLGFRLDYEAAAAYVALPPLAGIILLIAERNSDYVRFHAWQSSLLFTALLVAHLIISWSSFLSWVLFLADIALMAFLALRAYQDASTLDRYELPFFGQLASRFVDDE
ncbi:hypothetical protein VUR80DRAFT_2978 [Thermomyces stellatus]